MRTVHTRHEQGAAYMALGAALATGKPQAYAVVPGPGLLNSVAALLTAYGMNAPVLALIGANPARRHRPRARPPARDPRPGRHHRAAGRLFGAHPQRRARRRAWSPRRSARWRPAGPARPRCECAIDVWGKRRPVDAAGAAAGRRRRRSTRTRSRKAAKLLGAAKKPADRLRRRRAGRRRRSHARSPRCCRRRCSAIAAAAACSTAAIR